MEIPFALQKESQHKPKEKLRIETPGQRALEASLFIDKKFIDVAAVLSLPNMEDLFGKKEWDAYVDARKYTLEYGDRDLTVDFIKKVHKKAASANPQIAGKIRDLAVRAGDYNNPQTPVAYTESELAAIKANPYLNFESKGEENQGFINYPPPEDVPKLLQEICDWYNEQRETMDPASLAALLQRKLISVHPFFDSNGTISRIIMNWALQNRGLFPSMLENPSDDILTDESSWITQVKKGHERYFESMTRLFALEDARIEDDAFLLGVNTERAFYDYIYKHIASIPKLQTADGMLDHKNFEEFFKQFVEELRKFQSFLQSTSSIGSKTLTQGGLISSFYINSYGMDPLSFTQETRNILFTDINLFRGVSIDASVLDDQKICELLTTPQGVTTGYRAVEISDKSPLSVTGIKPEKVREAMDYYNKMIAKRYFTKEHHDKNPYATIGDLDSVLGTHIGSEKNKTRSPFASTSFSFDVSKAWAGNLPGVKYGALFVASAPKEGVVLSFSQGQNAMSSDIKGVGAHLGFALEKECLVAGGLDPNSISTVIIFEDRKPSFIAFKGFNADGILIVINDVRGEHVVSRTYQLKRGGKLQFVGQQQTFIKSAVLIAQKPPEEPVSVYTPLPEKEKEWLAPKIEIFSEPPKESKMYWYQLEKNKEAEFPSEEKFINEINFKFIEKEHFFPVNNPIFSKTKDKKEF